MVVTSLPMATIATNSAGPKSKQIGPVVLLGAPGAGKGTQSKKLAEIYDVPQISTGDILRENVSRGTELGRKAKDIMDRGELVPDALVQDMLLSRLKDNDCAKGFILDGFPRTIAQAKWLDSLFEQGYFKAPCDRRPLVINISVGYNLLLKRLSGRRSCPTCGRIYNIHFQPPRVDGMCDLDGSKLVTRKDDAEEVIAERLKTYEQQTLPLIDFYKGQGRLREINGEMPVSEVNAAVFEVVEHGDRV
jgi:adenylate kinase